jgi:hypothetical protein
MAIAATLFASLCFCVRPAQQSRHERAQTLLVLLPFALNSFLILGYYGFLISASLCFFVLGLLIRHGLTLPVRLQCVSACLLLAAYVSHPFPVAISFLFPCAWVLASALARRREVGLASAATARDALAMWPWLPPALLVVWFSLRLTAVEAPRGAAAAVGVTSRVVATARGAVLSISPGASAGTANSPGTYPPTAWLSVALLVLLLVAVLMHRRQLGARDSVRSFALTVLVIASLALSLIVPDRVGDGSGIVMRVLFHAAVFLVLLALVSGALGPRLSALCALVASLIAIGFAREYQLAASRLAPALAEVRAAMQRIPVHSRILILGYRMTPLCEGGPLLKMTFPERHAAMSGALANELIVLNDYQAHTSHFPLRHVNARYEDAVDEFSTYSAAQQAAWLEILRARSDVDWVVSWGLSGDPLCRTTVGSPYEYSLRGSFERVRLEEGASRVALWRRLD